MPKLVSITITTLVDDHIEADAVADAIMNTADMDGFNDAFDCEVELLESEVTLEVDAENGGQL